MSAIPEKAYHVNFLDNNFLNKSSLAMLVVITLLLLKEQMMHF